MKGISRSLAQWLVAGRYLLLAVAILLAAIAWTPSQRVAFDRSVENMFADDDPLLAPYLRLKRTFGGNEVVLAVYEDPHLFHPDRSGLDRLIDVRRRLERVPGVREVLTIDRPIGEAIVDPRSETARRTRQLFENYTHDPAGATPAAVCMLDPELAAREDTVRGLRQVMDSLPNGVGPDNGVEVRLRLDGLDVRVCLRDGTLRLVTGGEEEEARLEVSRGSHSEAQVEAGVSDWPLDQGKDRPVAETVAACRVAATGRDDRTLTIRIHPHLRRVAGGRHVQQAGGELRATFDRDRIRLVLGGRAFVVPITGRSNASTAGDQETGVLIRVVSQDGKTSADAVWLPERLPRGYLTGEPAMVVEGFRLLEQDGERLSLWSTILLGATVIACFRSVWWVAIPVAVVQLSLLLTRATFVWLGMELSMVSSMLTAIVTVIGVGMAVHVTVHFQEERQRGTEARAALVSVLAWLVSPIVFSAATDVAGFASLLTADVRPVQDFGVMMAIGAAYSGLAVLFVVPALLTMARRPGEWLLRRTRLAVFDPDPRPPWGQRRIDSQLRTLVEWADRRRWPIVVLTVLLLVAALAGSQRLEVETDFTRNFRPSNEIVRSYEFVESRLGGAGVLDILLPAPERLDWEYLSKVQALEQRLRKEVQVRDESGQTQPGLTKVLSLSDAVIAAAGDLEKNNPLLRRFKVNAALGVMQSRLPAFYAALYASHSSASDGASLRVMLRARERQPAEQKRRLIAQVERIVHEELAEDSWRPWLADARLGQRRHADVTGFFVLLTNLIDSMLQDQWTAFVVATGAIGVMSLAAMLLCDPVFLSNPPRRDYGRAVLRSGVLAAIAQVPNVLPILLVLGAMGWLGLKINLGAVMISAVSMGLSVDMSLHYLISFRRLHAAGASVDTALEEVQRDVGRAMVFSTLALIVGFTTLCVSEFVPTVYFGALVSLSMVGGMLGNLLLLPLLIKTAVRSGGKTASSVVS